MLLLSPLEMISIKIIRFRTIFKQSDNLGFSLRSYLGCISRNPRHAELRRKVGARAGKATVDFVFKGARSRYFR